MRVTEADLMAIRQVIEQQIKAFQENDPAAAFAQAAPGIQVQFGTAENFVSMVKAAYPPVHRPRSVMFENFLEIEGLPAQQVMLMDQEGRLIRATYTMQQQPAGRLEDCGLLSDADGICRGLKLRQRLSFMVLVEVLVEVADEVKRAAEDSRRCLDG